MNCEENKIYSSEFPFFEVTPVFDDENYGAVVLDTNFEIEDETAPATPERSNL